MTTAAAPTEAWALDFARLSPHIASALVYAGGSHTLEDVREGIATGTFQLWAAPDSCVITTLVVAPTGKKTLHYFLAAGHLAELEPLGPILEAWARAEGCAEVTCLGRHGWQRTFLTRDQGWTPTLTWYSKTLEHPDGQE